MRKSNKGFAVPIIVFILAIIAVGVSIYYFYASNTDNTKFFGVQVKSVDPNYREPLSELDAARLRAQNSRDLFKKLVTRYTGEQKAITSIQQEYAKLSDLLPSNTVVILRKKLPVDVRNQISAIQKKIDAALKAWKDKLADAKAKNPNISLKDLLAEAQSQAALLNSYTKELQDIINTLTPENSGMSQADIDDAKKKAKEAADAAKKEEESIQKVIDDASKTEDKTPTTPQTPVDNSNPPIVTPQDIDDAKKKADEEEAARKKAEEDAGIKKDVDLPTPTPTPDDYSSYDNNRYRTPDDPHYYDDLTSHGEPQIDGSPSKND